MKIVENREGVNLILQLKGRMDTTTAPKLQKVIDSGLDGILHLEIDMEGLEYVPSAGLRVLLAATKKMKAAEGSMIVTGANEDIREVFRITGFDGVLDVR